MVLKNGPSKICGRQPLKGCLPQILRGPFVNTLIHFSCLNLLLPSIEKTTKFREKIVHFLSNTLQKNHESFFVISQQMYIVKLSKRPR